MDKKDLEELSKLRVEEKDLQLRLQKFDRKPSIVIDGVRGSSRESPYIEHNYRIEGIDSRTRNQLKKMIKSNQKKINKKIKSIEYELNKIEDSELRQMIRFYYEDNKDYNQTAHAMNNLYNYKKYTADSVRMKMKREMKKM